MEWMTIVITVIIVVIVVAILITTIISYQSDDHGDYPIHSSCSRDRGCKNNLTCDIVCNKCKQKIGGACSTDIDCETGLVCNNWICSNRENIENKERTKAGKKVHWSQSEKD